MTTPTPPTLHPVVADAGRRAIHMYAEKDDWDLLPRVIAVHDNADQPLIPLDFPAHLWLRAHAATVLDALTTSINAMPHLMDNIYLSTDGGRTRDEHTARPVLVGALFVIETHAVNTDGMTRRQLARLERWRKRHRVQEHPNACEFRMITGVDGTGARSNLQHMRGSVPEREWSHGMSGNVPEAVERFYAAFAGKWNTP